MRRARRWRGRAAVAVTAALWDAIRRRCRRPAVGYPIVAADTPLLLSTDADEVLLDADDWNAGRMIGDADGWLAK